MGDVGDAGALRRGRAVGELQDSRRGSLSPFSAVKSASCAMLGCTSRSLTCGTVALGAARRAARRRSRQSAASATSASEDGRRPAPARLGRRASPARRRSRSRAASGRAGRRARRSARARDSAPSAMPIFVPGKAGEHDRRAAIRSAPSPTASASDARRVGRPDQAREREAERRKERQTRPAGRRRRAAAPRRTGRRRRETPRRATTARRRNSRSPTTSRAEGRAQRRPARRRRPSPRPPSRRSARPRASSGRSSARPEIERRQGQRADRARRRKRSARRAPAPGENDASRCARGCVEARLGRASAIGDRRHARAKRLGSISAIARSCERRAARRVPAASRRRPRARARAVAAPRRRGAARRMDLQPLDPARIGVEHLEFETRPGRRRSRRAPARGRRWRVTNPPIVSTSSASASAEKSKPTAFDDLFEAARAPRR